ncbi:class I mannose-6-phosphate isomerase [Actinophytocola gossypii]|uniref:Class I mannose-6-phosphate isomerase n=1 Tax=Actinophytocola gossypii TaxID=2812003 RepID=A0ABT2JAW8_9PSEU|nr:class I mannose-6-phosphate isomerase [Actinophytocola gossypii]MCT2585015.1 class I mannose-6-phosphate isomerase [Actinophytocola gossypii]
MSADDALGRRPVKLPANQPERFYRGGAAIAALRGTEPREFGPEDWVASCTTLHGKRDVGLSALPSGTLLRDAVAAHPEDWLGATHLARHGTDPALLVKLLDAGQRLPVHCHPSDRFAAAHYGSRYGKTEAWVVVGAAPGASVHLGFAREQSAETVADWVARQDTPAMLGALNEVPVRAGDTVFVPAGLPHAIGAGVFIVELQQPTDLSVTLEWKGFLDDAAGGHLGLGFETALGCVDRDGWADRLDTLVHGDEEGAAPVRDLFGAPEFFRAERVRAGAELAPSFGVLVTLSGTGVLRTEHAGDVPVSAGETFVLPHAAGATTVDGDLSAVRCLPPA